MLTITFDKSKLNHRPLSALIKYLSNKYIQNVVTTDNTIFFTEHQVDILKKAALLENAYVEDNYTFYYKDVFNKEQSFSKEDLLIFANNVKNQSLQIYFSKRKKTNKLTKERLQFIYIDCVNKLYRLAAKSTLDGSICRKVNHYRQLLDNNRDSWDYLTVLGNILPKDLNLWGECKGKLNNYSIYLDPKLTIKELVYKAKKYTSPSAPSKPSWKTNLTKKTIEWDLEQYAKHKAAKKAISNQYKMTITDCDTGSIVQEFYLPKS